MPLFHSRFCNSRARIYSEFVLTSRGKAGFLGYSQRCAMSGCAELGCLSLLALRSNRIWSTSASMLAMGGPGRQPSLWQAHSLNKQGGKRGAFNPVLQRQQDESSCLRSFHKSGAELGSGLTPSPSSPQP